MWTLGSRGWCERLAPWNGGPLPPGMRADERGNRHGPGLPLRRPSSRRASGSGGVRVFDTTIRRGALGPVSAVGARRARRSPCRPCRGQSVGRRARRRGERSDKGLVTLGSRRRRPADRDQRSCAIRAAPRSCAIGSAADRTYGRDTARPSGGAVGSIDRSQRRRLLVAAHRVGTTIAEVSRALDLRAPGGRTGRRARPDQALDGGAPRLRPPPGRDRGASDPRRCAIGQGFARAPRRAALGKVGCPNRLGGQPRRRARARVRCRRCVSRGFGKPRAAVGGPGRARALAWELRTGGGLAARRSGRSRRAGHARRRWRPPAARGLVAGLPRPPRARGLSSGARAARGCSSHPSRGRRLF